MELTWHLMDKEASEVVQNIKHPTLHGPFHPPNHETTLGNVGAVRNTITFFYCQTKNSYLVTDLKFPLYLQASFSKTETIQPSRPLFDLPS